MKAKSSDEFPRRLRSTILALPNIVVRHALVAGQDSLLVGFRGGPESDDERWARVGETRHFRVALIWSDRGPLASKEGLGTSHPTYAGSATLAVTGITVLGEGFGTAKKELTDENKPLHLPKRQFNRDR